MRAASVMPARRLRALSNNFASTMVLNRTRVMPQLCHVPGQWMLARCDQETVVFGLTWKALSPLMISGAISGES